jgi:tRNA G18 (ribose-2'-O)-methylase SpoU
MAEFIARLCTDPSCRLRVPIERDSGLARTCPTCGAEMVDDDGSWGTRAAPRAASSALALELVLDNIRSVRNVGSILRTAEGAGVEHVHVCGITPTPSHPKMHKTALGAEERIPWTRHRDPVAAADALNQRGIEVWVLEGGSASRSIFDGLAGVVADRPRIALVAGHEVAGVDRRLVQRANQVVAIPMHGPKASLNVSVAIGVALFALRAASSDQVP